MKAPQKFTLVPDLENPGATKVITTKAYKGWRRKKNAQTKKARRANR